MKTTFLGLATGTKLGARGGLAVLLLILLLVGFRSALLAVVTPFWYDEVITVLLCHLPSMPDIWRALNHAADTMPPGFYLVERLARPLVADDHLAYRLPSMLGVLITISCVYFVLSRRVSRLSALAGATFVLCTPLAGYAAEARPYGLLLGCISVAILAWQRIDDSKFYAPVLAIALAVAASLHYYAILVWPAFLVAEMSIWIVNRRFRVSVWASILAGALPVVFFVRLLLHLRQYYGSHFWAQPSIKQALVVYDSLFNLSTHWGWTFAAGMTVILLAMFIGKVARTDSPRPRDVETTGVPFQELTLALMLLWLPAIAVAAAKLSHGGMTDRYMLPTILGGAFAVGYVIEKASTAGRVLLLFLFLMQYASSSVNLVKSALHGSLLEQRVNASRGVDAIAEQTHEPALPIIISDNLLYLPTAYYTPASSQAKLYAISDPHAAVTFSGGRSDSADLNLLILRQYFPLQVADYVSFMSTHREFLLVSDEDPDDEWLPARLVYEGYQLTLISPLPKQMFAGFNLAIYRVTTRP